MERDSDETQHEVTLTKGFWMAKSEVDQVAWTSVMGFNPSEITEIPSEPGYSPAVENVSWNECQEFCEKLGLQLPTEAQWEYACRAGNTGAYAADDQMADNAWGLNLHHGTGYWCADWYGDYPRGKVAYPAGVSSGSKRVVRGVKGESESLFSSCRSANRDARSPDFRDCLVSFLPVKVPSAK